MGEKIGLKMREQDAKARKRRLFLDYVNLRQNVQGGENSLLEYGIDNLTMYKQLVDR
jgi:hypothetical protein